MAWQMDIKVAGDMAIVLMGLGTAALTSAVAVSSSLTRRLYFKGTSAVFDSLHAALPALKLFAGAIIIIISLSLRFVI